MSEARALWTIAPGRCAILTDSLPARGEADVLVRTHATGISRGTERLVLKGRVPEAMQGLMRAPFQAGAFPFPVKYGYSAVGAVEEGPADLVGRRVFCLHPHQDRFVVPSAMVVPVPDAVPDQRAVLAANMETAVNILWDARPLGERVLVLGAGVVGLLAAFLFARIPGLDLAIADPDPARAETAAALGIPFTAPEDAAPERDLIVHASGNPDGLRHALSLAAFEGRIVEASWFGDRQAALPLGEAFHAKRLSILSTQVGAVAPAMRGRRTHRDRLTLALSLLDDARLDALLGPVTPFDALPRAMPALLDGLPGRPAPLCPVVTYIE